MSQALALAGPSETVELARIVTSYRTEVRVQVQEWDGRRRLDIRVWTMPNRVNQYQPTPRGVRIALEQVPALVAALKAHFP
jgi:hypothetical protein